MRAPFHDPLIIPLEGEYLGLSTDLRIAGVMARTSPDLVNWSEPFPLLPETPAPLPAASPAGDPDPSSAAIPRTAATGQPFKGLSGPIARLPLFLKQFLQFIRCQGFDINFVVNFNHCVSSDR